MTTVGAVSNEDKTRRKFNRLDLDILHYLSLIYDQSQLT